MKIKYKDYDVYVYTGGEQHQSNRDTMLFIHGAGMDHTVWTLFSRFWAKAGGCNVVALDLPGHGLTGGEPVDTIEQHAEFVCGVLDKLHLQESVYIVGHSMGSLVALECAARLRNAEKLAMLGTAVPMAVGAPLLDAARDNNHASVDMISLFGHSYGSQLGGNPIAGISAQLSAERLLKNTVDGVLYKALNACNEYKAGLDTAAGLKIPVGLILGEHDQMTLRRNTVDLNEACADVSVTVLPDCGHMMMSEKPEATHVALRQFIQAGPARAHL